jgi:sec-independent protein translocase protein TatC
MSADPNAATMTFWEHLEELRWRLIKMGGAFLLGAGVAWTYREQLLLVLTQPFITAWNAGVHDEKAALYFPAPAALFTAYIKLALLGGLVLALPLILYQVWAFVAPGLYSREKRFAVPFVVSSCSLFAGGGYFGWRVAFPIAFGYLLGLSGPVGPSFEVKLTVMVGEYLDFVAHMLVAFGIAFELPVFVFFLSIAGIVNHRHLIRFARYFVVLAFVIGAIFTPPDLTSQFLLAVPLCILYAISIGIAWIFGKPRRDPESHSDAAL